MKKFILFFVYLVCEILYYIFKGISELFNFIKEKIKHKNEEIDIIMSRGGEYRSNTRFEKKFDEREILKMAVHFMNEYTEDNEPTIRQISNFHQCSDRQASYIRDVIIKKYYALQFITKPITAS